MNLAFTHKKPKPKAKQLSFAICRCVIKPESYKLYRSYTDTETERCNCNGWMMFYQSMES